MKTLFIEAKSKIDISEVIKKVKLPGKIGLITTVQFLDQLPNVKKILKDSISGGQILGCNISNAEKIKDEVDCFLYIGDGQFHPLIVAVKTGKEVYVANPLANKVSKIDKKDVGDFKKRQKGALLRFLNAEKIGILVSTKPGQYNLEKALKLKKSLKKESFIFIFDTLDLKDLENFRNVDCWVNTACPRIEGKNIINIEDLPK